MINTKDFKTKSEILEKSMPRILGNNQHKGKTIVAIDGGYSAVKGVSPNKVFRYPSFAKKAPQTLEIVGKVNATDLQYRDNITGEVWLVGASAETMLEQGDIEATTDDSLYTRYRYDSPVYKVIMSTGLALGLLGTGSGNEIYLQTGLPATYKDRDQNKLINALCGDYDISIKVGNGDWVTFKFTLDEKHIFVMEQPQGTLCATAYDGNGNISQLGKNILSSNSIIFDVGFETEDIFSIRKGYKNSHDTYTDTGMKSVFDGVIKELIAKEPDADYKIFAFQSYLEDGKAPYFDVEKFKMNYIDFAEILEEVNKELCEKSLKRLIQKYNKLEGYQFLVVTGGTGESRYEQIKAMLSGFSKLTVLPGNVNTPELSFTYSNVIGYYLFRHANLAAEVRKSDATASQN